LLRRLDKIGLLAKTILFVIAKELKQSQGGVGHSFPEIATPSARKDNRQDFDANLIHLI